MATGRVVGVKGKKGVYHIIIELGRIGGKRKRIKRTFHGRKQDAERELDRLKQQLGVGLVLDADGITTGEYIRQWLRGREGNLGTRTYETYETHIERHIVPVLGHIPLAKLHPLQLDDFKAEKLDEGLSPRTVDSILITLSQAVKRAVQLRLLPYNPVDSIERPEYDDKVINVLEIAELKHLLSCAKKSPLYPLFYLAAYTGMRRGELLGLEWANVDLETGDVKICQQWMYSQKKGLHMGPLKSKKSYRTISIEQDVIGVLREIKPVGKYLFQSPDTGLPYHPSHVTKVFADIAKEAGFKGFRLHDLRHTHASHLLAAGLPLTEVQARLGHSLPSTTADNYLHPIESRRRNASKAFSQLMQDEPEAVELIAGGKIVVVDFASAHRGKGDKKGAQTVPK